MNINFCSAFAAVNEISGGKVTLDSITQMQVFFGGSERINLIADWTATQFAATFEESFGAKQRIRRIPCSKKSVKVAAFGIADCRT